MAEDMKKDQHYYDNEKNFVWRQFFYSTTKHPPNGYLTLYQYIVDCEYDLMKSFCNDEEKFVEFVKQHGEYLSLVIPVTRMKVKVLHNCFITKDTISGKNVLCGIHGMHELAPFKYVLVEDLVSSLKKTTSEKSMLYYQLLITTLNKNSFKVILN